MAQPNLALVTAIRTTLASHGDATRAIAQQAYMKSAMPYRGITTADLRALVAAELAHPEHRLASRDEWEATLRVLWDEATHREERYAALAVARHRTSRTFRATPALHLYRHFVATGAWWDLVDETATNLVRGDLATDPEGTGRAMRAWCLDPDLWVRRAAILCQIGARDAVDLVLLADVIRPNLEGAPTAPASGKQDFFIRKAIGWALRDAARRHPAWVRGFVDEHRAAMAGLSVREATKHLRDDPP